MEDKLNVTVLAEEGQITIRQGEALPEKEPRREILECTLPGVHEWLTKRADEFVHSNALITYDVNEGAIHFVESIVNPYTNMVTGRLQVDPDLKKFKINTGKYESPEDMANRIRSLSYCFTTRNDAMALVSSLKNFKANVSNDIESTSNDRGSAKRLRNQIVESNLPEAFSIFTPMIKGGESKPLKVLIFANETLDVTLFSYDLQELMQAAKTKAIREEVDQIKESFPEIPVIEV